MSPDSFTFKLSVPNDPDSVAIIGEVARHAADYAKLDGGVAQAFADRARAAAATAVKAGDGSTVVVVAVADGTLTLTMGDESVSQPLS